MRKRNKVWILVLVFTLMVLAGPPERTQAASTPITNGTDWFDTAGNPIQANSGNILQVGNTYYWYGEHAVNGKFDSVNVYTSTDLKNWTFNNAILTKHSADELGSSKIERPKVIYNASTEQYVLWAHYENGTDYNLGRVAVATSSTPDGPFNYVGSFRPLNYESRDMTVFVDTDGTGYLVTASRKNGGANDTMAIFKMNADYTNVESFEGWLFENAYREAPAIVKKGTRYYLFTSQASGWYPNQGAYATATSMTGPWSALKPFGNSSAFASQIHDIATITGESTTSYIYMGDRWNPMKLGEHKHIWLPLSLNDADGTASLDWYKEWDIDATTGTITLPELVNHAQGQPATAISTASGSSPSHVNDGNYQTSWVASSNTWPAWWQVDLGSAQTITEVDISWFMYKGSEGYYKYKIEVSNDGVNYSTIDRTNNLTYGFTTDAVHFTARYVRIQMVNAVLWNNPGNWYTPTLHEVKLLGPAEPEFLTHSRFSSHNYPERYIRHANFAARIDTNVSPELDSHFRVIPGLANTDGVSLESINFPGYFLKRDSGDSSNKIILGAYSNTDSYKGDATFRIVPGWAESNKLSFESYNQPGSYIRHYDYALRLDTVNESSSSTLKSDATFGRVDL